MLVSDQAKQKAEDIRDAASVQYQRINANGNLSPVGVQAAYAKVFVAAKAAMERLKAQSDGVDSTRARTLTTQVWGVDDLAGPGGINRVAVSMSYRDAQGRVADIDDPNEALRLLATAEASGDELLARAIAQHAWMMGLGWSDVLDAYLGARPTAAAAFAKLQEMSRPAAITDMWAFVLPAPAILGGLDDNQLAVLAAKVDV